MRPTPTRLPDDLLAKACPQLVDGPLETALANPAVRAAVQAAVRAELHPNPRAPRKAPRRQPCAPTSFAFGDLFEDLKRRAANDIDEE